jgi:hypothetical protein
MADNDEQKAKSESGVTSGHVAALAVVIVGLLVALWLVLQNTENASEATNVLGVVIPAFATIGAAVFGITAAYRVGNATGESKGKEDGKEEVKKAIRPLVERLESNATEQVIVPLRRNLVSESGSDFASFSVGGEGIPNQAVVDIEADIRTLAALVE